MNRRHFPFILFSPVTWTIFLINGLVFSWCQLIGPDAAQDVVDYWGFTPWNLQVPSINDKTHIYATIFAHQWIQVAPDHFMFNMALLLLTGATIEPLIGKLRFTIIYLTGGLFSVLVFYFTSPDYAVTPLIGSSGAVAVILGAYAMNSLVNRKRLVFAINIVLTIWIIIWFWNQLVGVMNIKDTTTVGYWAHVGGFVFGATWMFFWTKRRGPFGPLLQS